MAIAAGMERFLEILRAKAPARVDELAPARRRVRHGLLSVGLKLHCVGDDDPLRSLIEALGGRRLVLERNVYKQSDSNFCLVLPPLGSAHAAILLLESIEEYAGCSLFNNPQIQLQVCSPGRLTPRNAALHAIGFYLSSDTLRRYALNDFATTVSEDYYHRGKRIVIHDAGPYGDFDAEFEWWARTSDGLSIRPNLPFLSGRTDILVGPGSKMDIYNINLLATLLVHAQSADGDGYWSSLGRQLTREMTALLERHMLAGLVDAPWVCATELEGSAKDLLFYSALQELTSYATGEADRLGYGEHAASAANQQGVEVPGGILKEVQSLMAKYRGLILSSSAQEHGDAP